MGPGDSADPNALSVVGFERKATPPSWRLTCVELCQAVVASPCYPGFGCNLVAVKSGRVKESVDGADRAGSMGMILGGQPTGGLVSGLGVESSDREIYEKHAADLIRYATVLVGPDEAPDVVSSVVLRVLKRRSLDDLDDPRAYLFRSVMNECRTWRRRRQARRVALSRFFERDGSEMLDTTVADRVSAAEAVWGLPPRLRSATYLVYWLDLSIGEAAQVLGLSPGTVKRYVHEARERIREELS